MGANNKIYYLKVQNMVIFLLNREITQEKGQGLKYKIFYINQNRNNNYKNWNNITYTTYKGQYSKEDY